MYFGRWRNKEPTYTKTKWTKQPIKALRVHHHVYGVNLDWVWLEKINEVKRCIEVWKSRDSTFSGEVLITPAVLEVVWQAIF